MSKKEVFEAVRLALSEDIGKGDITAKAVFKEPKKIQAAIIAKEQGILSGICFSMAAFKLLDKKIKFMPLLTDGVNFKKNTTVAFIEGNAQTILTAERVALNFLSRLSGIATLTSRFVRRIKPYEVHPVRKNFSNGVKIMDTRKTTPGLREIEKYAVRTGGGCNHRMGLYDRILIKDNHLKATGYDWARIHSVVKESKKKGIITEIETANMREVKEALKCRPDIVMLDNMKVDDIKAAVKLRNFLTTHNLQLTTKLEVSGGVNLNNVRKFASTGVDMISVGALTHSAKPVDFSLDVIQTN